MTPADCQFLATLAPPSKDWQGTGALKLIPSPADYPMTLLPGMGEVLEAGALTPVDYSGDVQDIYNQGAEPSCVSFSTCGLASTEDFRGDRSWDTLDGHRFYVMCGGNGRDGIDSRVALDRARNDGIPLLSGAGSVRVGTYVFATQTPEQFRQEIAAALVLGHFVTIALLLPSDFGWNSSLNAQKTSGYHQIYAVGFTGLTDADYVICVNSWGKGHGNNGLVRVPWGYLERDNLQQRYVFAFAVTPLVLPNPNPTPNPQPTPDVTGEMIRLVQQARAAAGLREFTVNTPLMKAAGDYAREMGTTNNYAHNSVDGSTPWDRMQRAGFAGNGTWGENIAAGQADPSALAPGASAINNRDQRGVRFTPGGSFTDWMNSPGHRSNILNPAFTDIGVGFAEVPGSQYGRYWVQDFAVSGAGPQPDPQPEPVTLRVDSVLGTTSVAACAHGETFRVTGSGFGAGVIQARIGLTPATAAVQNDGLLVVTAPTLPSDLLPLYVRREGVEVAAGVVVITAAPGPTPEPEPDPNPNPDPQPDPNPQPGELKIALSLPSRVSRTRVLIQAGVTFMGVPALATVKVSAGGASLGEVQTLPSGLARLIVSAVAGTTLTVDAVDTAGHRGTASVTV